MLLKIVAHFLRKVDDQFTEPERTQTIQELVYHSFPKADDLIKHNLLYDIFLWSMPALGGGLYMGFLHFRVTTIC